MQPATGMPPTTSMPPATRMQPATGMQPTSGSMPTSPQTSAPGPQGANPSRIAIPAPPWSGEVAAAKTLIVPLTGRWGWPVPRWQGRSPVISDGFGSPRPGSRHMGVDLMFARIASDPFPIGPNASKGFVMPDAWMAVAASDGVLWSAGSTPRGFAVVLDHGHAATFYQHLATLLVPETKPPAKDALKDQRIRVRAGQPLGVIGADPLDHAHLKHLHFELWPGGPASAIDPQPLMKSWQVFTPNDISPFLQAMRRNAPKKRPLGAPDFVSVWGYERRWPGTSLNPPR
jgi:hypothetical protein